MVLLSVSYVYKGLRYIPLNKQKCHSYQALSYSNNKWETPTTSSNKTSTTLQKGIGGNGTIFDIEELRLLLRNKNVDGCAY